jgi:hypothetical protein
VKALAAGAIDERHGAQRIGSSARDKILRLRNAREHPRRMESS